MKTYDVAIIGNGTMGSAAAWQLSKTGKKILVVDPNIPPHDLGAHSGKTRIIRKSYFEHPDYVPLLERSYEYWKFLEQELGMQIYYPSGLLYMGQSESLIIKGIQTSSSSYNIPLIHKSPSQIAKDHPLFDYHSQGMEYFFEPDAGYLMVDKAFEAFFSNTIKQNVTYVQEDLFQWDLDGEVVRLKTRTGEYVAEKIIFTAGPWSDGLLPLYNLPLKVHRQMIAWIKPKDPSPFTLPSYPSWFIQDPTYGMYYGFAGHAEHKGYLKLALHAPGERCTPDHINRTVIEEDHRIINHFVNQYMPLWKTSDIKFEHCLYTMTPDEHFIIDYLPHLGQKVILACGFSGHGFKFAPVIGELLKDMALYQKEPLPLFTINRFSK